MAVIQGVVCALALFAFIQVSSANYNGRYGRYEGCGCDCCCDPTTITIVETCAPSCCCCEPLPCCTCCEPCTCGCGSYNQYGLYGYGGRGYGGYQYGY